jgi:hypothetical protein
MSVICLLYVQAVDMDLGENANIKYSVLLTDEFTIHEETGVIYPVSGAFRYKDTHFTVRASDAEGEGEPLEVNVSTNTPGKAALRVCRTVIVK